MSEVPEQVLPQEGLTARRGVEEVRTDRLVEEQHDGRTRQDRDGQEHQNRRDEERPDRQREPEPLHARCAHVDDRRDVVGRSQDRRQPQHGQAQQPELLAPVDSRVLADGRQRRVGGPPGRRVPALHEEAREHQDAAGDGEPERPHVEPRERHVRRADLERDQVVAEHAHQERHDGEEHHEGAVHGDQRVVELREQDAARRHRLGKQPAAGHRGSGEPELPADHDGRQAAHREEDQAHQQELDADDLVVGRKDVLPDEAQLVGLGVMTGALVCQRCSCHGAAPYRPSVAGACAATHVWKSSAVCTVTSAPIR